MGTESWVCGPDWSTVPSCCHMHVFDAKYTIKSKHWSGKSCVATWKHWGSSDSCSSHLLQLWPKLCQREMQHAWFSWIFMGYYRKYNVSVWSHHFQRHSLRISRVITYIISSEVTVNLSDYSNSQRNGPVGQQAAIRRLTQLLLAAADPSPYSLDAVRLGPLVRAAAAAGGGQQPGTSLGEPRLGGGQQEQHQYQTPRQQRDANAGRKHCPTAGSHLSCTPASSHPISPPWSFQGV